jgi:hypothetical protein
MYKSAELCKEEQAIVEHALNSLVDGIEKTSLGKYNNRELGKKIRDLKMKRDIKGL